jgi:hypothetical protein
MNASTSTSISTSETVSNNTNNTNNTNIITTLTNTVLKKARPIHIYTQESMFKDYLHQHFTKPTEKEMVEIEMAVKYINESYLLQFQCERHGLVKLDELENLGENKSESICCCSSEFRDRILPLSNIVVRKVLLFLRLSPSRCIHVANRINGVEPNYITREQENTLVRRYHEFHKAWKKLYENDKHRKNFILANPLLQYLAQLENLNLVTVSPLSLYVNYVNRSKSEINAVADYLKWPRLSRIG